MPTRQRCAPTYHIWIAQHVLGASGAPLFSYADLSVLHGAVLRACDALDGSTDGIIAAEARCRFSPRSIICGQGGQAGACLTMAQALAAEALYEGPRDTAGRALYFGFPFGSEYSWIEQARASLVFATSFVSYATARGRGGEVDVRKLDFSPASVAAYQSAAPVLNALDPDLARFGRAGGRLIMWHGETDTGVPPGSTLSYVRKVRERLGTSMSDRMLRVYMVPGVNHCGGGSGPDVLDLLTPLVKWVEEGEAPDQIDAAKRGNAARRWTIVPFTPSTVVTGQSAG